MSIDADWCRLIKQFPGVRGVGVCGGGEEEFNNVGKLDSAHLAQRPTPMRADDRLIKQFPGVRM